MAKPQEPNQVRFSKPVVGRLHYVVRGPLGHPNLVDRKKADTKLLDVLGDIPLGLAVEGLANMAPPPPKQFVWEQVRDFLGKLLSSDPEVLDVEAIVSLWAHTLEELRVRRGN